MQTTAGKAPARYQQEEDEGEGDEMAVNADNVSYTTVQAAPVFMGFTEKKEANALSAEEYLARVEGQKARAPQWNGERAISEAVAGFRDEAHRWYFEIELTRDDAEVVRQMKEDWDFFTTAFKKKYFEIISSLDTTYDFMQMRQRPSEKVVPFMERVYMAVKKNATLTIKESFTAKPITGPDVRDTEANRARVWGVLDAGGRQILRAQCQAIHEDTAKQTASAMAIRITLMALCTNAADHRIRQAVADKKADLLSLDALRDFLAHKSRTLGLDRRTFPGNNNNGQRPSNGNGRPNGNGNGIRRQVHAVNEDETEEAFDCDEQTEDNVCATNGSGPKQGKRPQGQARGRQGSKTQDQGAQNGSKRNLKCTFCGMRGHNFQMCYKRQFYGVSATKEEEDKLLHHVRNRKAQQEQVSSVSRQSPASGNF